MNGSTIEMLQSQRFPDEYAQCRNAEPLGADGDDQNCLLPLLEHDLPPRTNQLHCLGSERSGLKEKCQNKKVSVICTSSAFAKL